MKYGMLLISETQGVGKSTLGEDVLRHLIGNWNYSAPSANEVCESNFNDWCAHKRLAVIHEIYEDYKNKGYERLKSVLTESTLKINAKYMAKYEIDNWLHVIACSNNKRALKIGMEDRRWLVPEVREQKRSPEDWQAFHAWLDNGGLANILWWFDRWLEGNAAVVEGEEAPAHRRQERRGPRELWAGPNAGGGYSGPAPRRALGKIDRRAGSRPADDGQ